MGWLRAVEKKKNPQAIQLSPFKNELRRVPNTLQSRENEPAKALEQQTATGEILCGMANSRTRIEKIHYFTFSAFVAFATLLFVLCRSAEAQQPKKIARIGYLTVGDPVSRRDRINALRQGLKELGYVEGKDIVTEYRFAEGARERLPDLAQDLVGLKVDVIFAQGTPATLAANNATQTVPIVTVSDDPVGRRVVAGLPRPGGNITGLINLSVELVGKRLELLKEAVPGASRVAFLCSPSTSTCRSRIEETKVIAQSLRVQLQLAEIKARQDLEPAFAALKGGRADALITVRTPLIVNDLAQRIVDLADKNRLPAMYDDRRFTRLGGLMSYGTDLADLDRRAAIYIDKILKGAKPVDLPMEQPTRFELTINLKTAKTLRLKIPAHMLLEAAVVIE